jgi:colanic acid biosynthesis glycosyl transferase WcaI
VVLYAGNLGEKQGIEMLVEAARRLAHRPEIRFVIAGDGAARTRLQTLATGLDGVRWVPLQPAERLNELLNAADIHVLPQRGDAADLVMPSKLTGMLASGRPTVGTARAGTQLGDALDQCGVRVPPDDGEALAAALGSLASDLDRRLALGHAGRAFAVATMSNDAILERAEAAMLFVMK